MHFFFIFFELLWDFIHLFILEKLLQKLQLSDLCLKHVSFLFVCFCLLCSKHFSSYSSINPFKLESLAQILNGPEYPYYKDVRCQVSIWLRSSRVRKDITTENDDDDVRDNRRRKMFSLKISGEPSAMISFC